MPVKAYYQNHNPPATNGNGPPPPQMGDDPPIILLLSSYLINIIIIIFILSINVIVTFLFTRYLEAEGLEKTYHFKQSDIVKAVDISTANKVICKEDNC